MNRFDDKVVIITGASGGLGHAAAVRLAKEGARLVLVGRNMEKLESAKKDSEKAGADEILIIQADVTREDQVKSMVDETIEKFGRIDGFIL